MSVETASGAMNCENYSELLADFLLDELPPSQAVLVHEHLNLCPACMKAYKELKGTGKALEAIPSMRAIEGSEEFKATVQKKALIESEAIVAKLPPDKRVRLEARRAARLSQRTEKAVKPPQKVLSPSLLLLIILGVAALVVIIGWPRGDSGAQRNPLGTLSVASGKVEQFYQKENQPHTSVAEGRSVFPGDAFSTPKDGRARFDVAEGGSIFVGPDSEITYRAHAPGTDDFVINLEKGELGIDRSDEPNVAGTRAHSQWEVRCEAGAVSLSHDAHAYFKTARNDKVLSLDILVLSGTANVTAKDSGAQVTLEAGQKITVAANSATLAAEPVAEAAVPLWRLDLVTEADLANLISGNLKIKSRKEGRVEAEISYGKQGQNHDWMSEPAGVNFSEKAGPITVPPGVKMRLNTPLAAPLALELNLNAESRRETSFAFGVLESQHLHVVVDVQRDAMLQVQENARNLHREAIPARTQGGGAAERLILEINREGAGCTAQLATTAGKTKALALPKGKTDVSGEVWIQALGDGLILDEIKIRGVLPVEWLRQRLSDSALP